MRPKSAQSPKPLAVLPDDDEAFVRLPTVLAVFPVSQAEWYRGIAQGRYPKPFKLSKRISAWMVGDIRTLLRSRLEQHAP